MNNIVMVMKECISAHASVQTEDEHAVGFFLSAADIERIANDVAEAMQRNSYEKE